LKRIGREEAKIGGNSFTAPQKDHVTGNEVASGDDSFRTIAQGTA
jgi:hypothetical protein